MPKSDLLPQKTRAEMPLLQKKLNSILLTQLRTSDHTFINLAIPKMALYDVPDGSTCKYHAIRTAFVLVVERHD